ncbi:MAG: HD domain-containing protein [Erysipelotrichaceae bacterium]|nr:HD domain-containing protein [Erysipelotrichaceae bacterium]MBQ6216652.1 HD domain-containing protein [Erysipelotrichaceae bacterium]
MAKKVKDFTEGERVSTPLLISSLVRGTTNSGNPYLSLVLQDSTKSIEAKLWDVKPELEKQLEVGKVYDFDVEVIKYKNNLQAKVLKVLPLPQSEIDMDEFVFRSPVSKETLRSNIQEGINMIGNENIAKIVSGALNYYNNSVYDYPAAAKIHHNFIGGLATHTSGMIKVAAALCTIYPSLNRDYLIAGVIIHDLGKIEELTSPVVTEYTKQGKLLGHISIMDARLLQIGKDLGLEDSEELLLLRHMVLSHHGQLEYGSPVRPETMEAEMLNLIDNIDARINTIDKALDEVKQGEFTQKIFALENRVFYKHK